MASLFPFQMGLKLMGLAMKFSSSFRKEIYNPAMDYNLNATLQITTRAGDANLFIKFKDGTMKSGKGVIENPDLTLVYKDKDLMAAAISTSAEDTLDLLLSGDLYYTGNMAILAKFSYINSIFPSIKKRPVSSSFPPPDKITEEQEKMKPFQNVILAEKIDKVRYLNDPYLGNYTIQDFPALFELKNRWFSEHVWMCHERAKNITDFFQTEGFDTDLAGKPWNPALRQGKMLQYLLENKSAKVFEGDLLPGSTTSKRMGVQLFPEFGALTIWPELHSVHARKINPYHIDQKTINILNEVFPFWIDRNIREQARAKYGNPLSQQLEEYFVLYFMWKTQAISHTIPNFTKALEKGLVPLRDEITEHLNQTSDPDKKAFYEAMICTLEGVVRYADNLRREVERQVNTIKTTLRRKISEEEREQLQTSLYRLEKMLKSLWQVPNKPAVTFQDAIIEVWILWLCLHQENMNAGLSIGRLDQILYPYFAHDMENATSEKEKEVLLKDTIELIGAFYLKCQDHLPLVPNVGNKLFGGSSSDQAITLGGVTPEGENAVNDLTYIFLKVTELITLRDPNVNARFHPEKNSREYLQRLCEVNINTTSTPSIHNDKEMIQALIHHGFKPEDARNWGATGCVEPTSIGKHFGHTNCMLFNLVAPLEILMNNGYHPLIHPKIGPETGEFTLETFPSFQALLEGFKTQLAFFIRQAVEYNNNLGIIHQEQHPTPFLSAIFDGPTEAGKDVVDGGALYNSSGVACVALADIVDSLFALKSLVYDKKIISLEEFKDVCDRDFSEPNDKVLLERIKRVPKFGSDTPETNEFAQELVDFLYEEFRKEKNYRGGEYFIGLWSMSNHVAFGKLSGTLPSGRLRGKAFTPGITPAPSATDALLQNIKSVASLDSLKLPNNIAFNIKLVPGPQDTHEDALRHFVDYTKSYFDLGGLQIQFNVVTSDTLRDAMVNPENYRWLMVRISGYNAYFTTLNEDMQIELIERMEFHA